MYKESTHDDTAHDNHELTQNQPIPTSEQSMPQSEAAQTLPPPTQPMLKIPTVQPVFTYILLAINVLIFLGELAQQQQSRLLRDQTLLLGGMLDFGSILQGEYYRLFTAMFLHLNTAHIGLNAYALWIAGSRLERLLGRTRFILIYILGGLVGSVVSFIFMANGAGASGAIFAIFGAELAFILRNRKLFGKNGEQMLRSVLIFAGINFAFGLYTMFAPDTVRIGVEAHAGGFVAGLLMGYLIGPQYKIAGDPAVPQSLQIVDTVPQKTIWLVLAGLAFGLTVIFFIAVSFFRARYLLG